MAERQQFRCDQKPHTGEFPDRHIYPARSVAATEAEIAEITSDSRPLCLGHAVDKSGRTCPGTANIAVDVAPNVLDCGTVLVFQVWQRAQDLFEFGARLFVLSIFLTRIAIAAVPLPAEFGYEPRQALRPRFHEGNLSLPPPPNVARVSASSVVVRILFGVQVRAELRFVRLTRIDSVVARPSYPAGNNRTHGLDRVGLRTLAFVAAGPVAPMKV